MAHYALIDDSMTVVFVITGIDEGTDGVDWEQHYGDFHGMLCRRTSYNTRGGAHVTGGTPLRKNYAGIGYTYDEQRDAFIPPQPYASWVLNENSCMWESPELYPDDGKMYSWDEATVSWVLIEEQ